MSKFSILADAYSQSFARTTAGSFITVQAIPWVTVTVERARYVGTHLLAIIST